MMHVGVVGGGRMGKDVFDLFSRNGFAVTLYVRRPDAAAALEDELLGPLRRRAAKGGGRAAAAEAQLKVLQVTSDLAALAGCDLINENIAEELEVKRALFTALEQVCRPDCIFSTDSSFITPDLVAEGLAHPERVIGLHFFYPTKLTSFVEVIPGPQTAATVTDRTIEAVKALRVRPILCRNVPGFLVNRMIPAFYNEGVLLLEEGYFTASEIDAAGRTLSHVGPLEACDQIGIDLVEKGNLEFPEIWREGWINPPLLEMLVQAGRLGLKSGKGVYAYPEGRPVEDGSSLPRSPRHHSVPAYERQDVIDRLYYTVVVEAFRQLDLEVGSAEDIDATLKEVLGFKSGPIQATRERGLDVARAKLDDLAARFGDRFAPRGSLAG